MDGERRQPVDQNEVAATDDFPLPVVADSLDHVQGSGHLDSPAAESSIDVAAPADDVSGGDMVVMERLSLPVEMDREDKSDVPGPGEYQLEQLDNVQVAIKVCVC